MEYLKARLPLHNIQQSRKGPEIRLFFIFSGFFQDFEVFGYLHGVLETVFTFEEEFGRVQFHPDDESVAFRNILANCIN